jgi:hypothetical protein
LLKRDVNLRELAEGLARKAIGAACKLTFSLDGVTFPAEESRGLDHRVVVVADLTVEGCVGKVAVAITCIAHADPKRKVWEAAIPSLPVELERRLKALSPESVRHHCALKRFVNPRRKWKSIPNGVLNPV